MRHFGSNPQLYGLLSVFLFIGTDICLPLLAQETTIDYDQYYGKTDIFVLNRLPDLPGEIPSDTRLESSGAIIGRIIIHIKNIFNLQNPKEDKFLYSLVNKLHVTTRETVIRDQLLFKQGDLYLRRILAETERNLRARDYFYGARIFPIAYHDNVVDVVVISRDVWTLSLGVNYSRQGGEDKSSIIVQETNLFGFGKQFGFSRNNSVDRIENEFLYKDENIAGGRHSMSVKYSDNSDGNNRAIKFERPFYALDTQWSYGADLQTLEQTTQLFSGGVVFDRFTHNRTVGSVYGGYSRGYQKGRIVRWQWGYSYTKDEYTSHPDTVSADNQPKDNRLAYPWLSTAIIEDKFLKSQRLYQSGDIEDVNVGDNTSLKIGLLGEITESNVDGIVYNAAYSSGQRHTASNFWFYSLSVSGRVEDSKSKDVIVATSSDYFIPASRKKSFFINLQLKLASNFSNQDQFTLGGDTGLRGYPLRYQAGNKLALLTLETRFYSDTKILHTFRVGTAIFFDIGRAWDANVADNKDPGPLQDIGFGLRFASMRTSDRRVLHLDVAIPLDGNSSVDRVQFLVKTKDNF